LSPQTWGWNGSRVSIGWAPSGAGTVGADGVVVVVVVDTLVGGGVVVDGAVARLPPPEQAVSSAPATSTAARGPERRAIPPG
jgi:hypothetical protein